jgi:hypothetical protein|tara:strand:+ start:449 stop:631 length:183 start_codon:yes stop_codon:yes gene_type:complete
MSDEVTTMTATIEIPVTVNVDGGIQDPSSYLREWITNCEWSELELIADGEATVSNIRVQK